MGRPCHPLRATDLRTLFPHKEVLAYPDTLGLLFIRRLPRAAWNTLVALAEGRVVDGRGRALDARGAPPPATRNALAIIILQPSPALLRFVATLHRSSYFITRVDVSVDFICESDADARRCETSFQSIMLQNYHGDRARNRCENTLYWGDSNARRNLALYADKPSKATGEPCAHIDLRYADARACGEAKVDDLLKLADGTDAMRLLKREARLAFIDERKFEAELKRWAAELHAGKGPSGRRPLEAVERRLRGLVKACTQNNRQRPINEALDGADVQEVLERFPRFRECLLKRNWEEVLQAPPRWVSMVKVPSRPFIAVSH